MQTQTKISSLEIENVKRVKAVYLTPTENGLTIIGGYNNQGKTSVLNAIAWALGGDKKKPSEPRRDGSALPPSINITLTNGFKVTRSGSKSSLKVIDPSNNKSGQQILNEFISEFALDLPKFMAMKPSEKANMLLNIIGVGEELALLEEKEKRLYYKRREIGQIAEQKRHHASELPFYPDAPMELISASELISRQQSILLKNAENMKARNELGHMERQKQALAAEIEKLELELIKKKNSLTELAEYIVSLHTSVDGLIDESTAELEKSIADIDEINRQVRTNMDKQTADEEAENYSGQYESLTLDIEEVRNKKKALLDGADLPLPELSVVEGELTYKGYRWDNISGSDQLKVAAAIVRKLNPRCGFVLLDKLEQMDIVTLEEFGRWLETEELQAIATRVSTGSECSIIIEDGYAGEGAMSGVDVQKKPYKDGDF